MFQNPGGRSRHGTEGEKNFRNYLTVGVQNNVVINTTSVVMGNTSGGSVSTTFPSIQVANSTAQTVIISGNSSFSNSTANTQVGPGTVKLQGAGSNAGLTLGTSSIAGNGYSFMPNGLLMQWGNHTVNSTAATVTFPVAFPTACFSVVITSNTHGTTNAAAINICAAYSITTTGFSIQNGNATASAANWMAVGN